MKDSIAIDAADLDLYNQFKAGDKKAYQHLFERYYPQLVKFAILYVKDSDVAEEIVQDFFVKLWIQKESLEIISAPKSYLFRAIRNRSFNYIRDKKIHLDISEDLSLIDKISSHTDNQNFDLTILQDAVKKAIESLPDKCRKIYKLSREDELTYKQISEKLNVSPKTVENQMGIALKKLRESLQPVLRHLITVFIVFCFSGSRFL